MHDYSSLIAQASNIFPGGDNPPFDWTTDFLSVYPQYGSIIVTNPDGSTTTTDKVPPYVREMFLAMANSTVLEKRWKDSWKYGMCLFLAHHCHLYMQTSAPVDALIGKVMSLGKPQGLASSKSVGDVSVSYDFGTISEALARWGTWNLTTYGQQFANYARLLGKGGMYVW